MQHRLSLEFLQRVCIWLLADDGQGLCVLYADCCFVWDGSDLYYCYDSSCCFCLSMDELIMAFNLRSFHSRWSKL